MAETLARAFPNMDALMAATEEQLAAVDGVGPKIAHSTYLFLRTPDNVQVIERLAKHGVRLADDVEAQAADALPQTLEGLTFVLTGSLTQSGMKRDEEDQLRGRWRSGGQQVRQGRGAGRPRA